MSFFLPFSKQILMSKPHQLKKCHETRHRLPELFFRLRHRQLRRSSLHTFSRRRLSHAECGAVAVHEALYKKDRQHNVPEFLPHQFRQEMESNKHEDMQYFCKWLEFRDPRRLGQPARAAQHDDSGTATACRGAAVSLVCNCIIYCDLLGANPRLRLFLLNRDQTAQTQNAII